MNGSKKGYGVENGGGLVGFLGLFFFKARIVFQELRKSCFKALEMNL